MAKAKDICPICGEKALIRDTQPTDYQYKGNMIVVKQPGYWCGSCGEAIINAKDAKATQKELQAFRSRVDGLMTPAEIKQVRIMLELNQHQAGDIFGGGPNAFSRYERGETAVPKPLSLLFGMLKDHPERFEDEIRPLTRKD